MAGENKLSVVVAQAFDELATIPFRLFTGVLKECGLVIPA